MNTQDKTNQELLEENSALKQKIQDLEKAASDRKSMEKLLLESGKTSKRLLHESELISEIGRIISSTLSIEKVYGDFAKKVRQVIPADRITVSTVDMKDYTRTIRYADGDILPGTRTGDVIPLAGTEAEQAVRSKSSLIINKKDKNGMLSKFPGIALSQHRVESAIIIPLISKDMVIGIFAIHSLKKNAYSKNDLLFAERVALQIAGGIANAQLLLEHEQAETELRKSEEKYRSLASISDWLYVVDKDCRYLYANEKYLHTFSSRNDSLIGRKFDEFHADDSIKNFTKSIKYVFETGTVCMYEFFNSRTGLSLLQKLSPVRGIDGSIIAVTAISIDISKRKQMETELEQHKIHLEEMVKERTVELETKNKTLQELNAALRVLLDQREYDKKEMEAKFVMSLQNLVLPFVDQMKKGRLDFGQQTLLDTLEKQIHCLLTPLMKNMQQFNLTPREIKVAVLVREGKSTKEIAEVLKISSGSIDIHRKNIRKKLSLSNRRINLESYLQTLDQ